MTNTGNNKIKSTSSTNFSVKNKSESIIAKGTMKKNNIAHVMLIVGISLFILVPFVFIVVNSITGIIIGEDMSSYFFNGIINSINPFNLMHIPGIIIAVIGIIIKLSTEKHEITVTGNRIYGKLSHNVEVSIELNQITGVKTCSCDGILISTYGAKYRFYCIENRKEIMDALSYLLSKPQNMTYMPT